MKILISLIIFITYGFTNIFDIKSYQGDFTQTITNNSNNEIKYKGKLYLDVKGNILWKYFNPKKNVYITNNQIIIDEPELEQAIISNIDEDLNLLKLLKQSQKIDNSTYVNTVNNIKYTIKVYNDIMQAIFYKDELDNNVKVTFSNIKTNEILKKDTFIFKAPSYYDIIRK